MNGACRDDTRQSLRRRVDGGTLVKAVHILNVARSSEHIEKGLISLSRPLRFVGAVAVAVAVAVDRFMMAEYEYQYRMTVGC